MKSPVSLVIAGLANPHMPGHLRSLKGCQDEVSLVALSEEDQSRREAAQQHLKDSGIEVPVYADFREMLDRHSCAEAILVGTDNAHHLPVYREAFARGLHIFSMKVITMLPEEAAELVELKAKSEVVFHVELELRHRPQFQKARELIRTGALGKIQSISLSNISQSPICYYPNWGVPELSYGRRVPLTPGARVFRGGALTDHPHPFDLIRWMTGLEFAEVTAFSSRNQREYLEVEDHLVLTGRLEDGTAVLVNPSYSHLEERATTRRLRWPKSLECTLKVFGEKGCYYADYFDHPVLVMGENHVSPDRLIVEGVPEARPGLSMLQHFVHDVRGLGRGEQVATFDDGLAAVRVMNAAYESLFHGRTERNF
jgi:predicted dehydrogenase